MIDTLRVVQTLYDRIAEGSSYGNWKKTESPCLGEGQIVGREWKTNQDDLHVRGVRGSLNAQLQITGNYATAIWEQSVAKFGGFDRPKSFESIDEYWSAVRNQCGAFLNSGPLSFDGRYTQTRRADFAFDVFGDKAIAVQASVKKIMATDLHEVGGSLLCSDAGNRGWTLYLPVGPVKTKVGRAKCQLVIYHKGWEQAKDRDDKTDWSIPKWVRFEVRLRNSSALNFKTSPYRSVNTESENAVDLLLDCGHAAFKHCAHNVDFLGTNVAFHLEEAASHLKWRKEPWSTSS